ncbi:MAG: enoyl-CoA hydratase [Motiliproteus sp.]
MSELIQVELKGQILSITLARPDKKNALTVAMYRALTDAIDRADSDPQIRVVHITGTADSFSSGNDLSDFLAASQSQQSGDNPAQCLLHRLNSFNKPIVAAVNGMAIGIGTTLLLHCDLVYAARSARFQLPFVDLGLVPEGGSSAILPAMLGHRRAAELLLACESLDATQAVDCGIVNRVCDDSELQAFSWQQAEKLAAKPPAAIQQAKAMLKHNPSKPLAQVIDDEIELFLKRLRSPEAAEAMAAFMERRKPDYSRF